MTYFVLLLTLLNVADGSSSKNNLLRKVEACYNENTISCEVRKRPKLEVISQYDYAIHSTAVLEPCEIKKIFQLKDCIIQSEPARTYER